MFFASYEISNYVLKKAFTATVIPGFSVDETKK